MAHAEETPDRLPQPLELLRGRSVAVLTGAGMSTDSGIPDYRGPTAPKANPMLYAEFVGSAENRRRYWSRSYRGWARMGHAEPNRGHLALARLEAAGAVSGVITQNVDGLHESAGSRRLIALHGRLSRVVCLDCGTVSDREALQHRLSALNPDFEVSADNELAAGQAELRPDGDAVVEHWQQFVVPECLACGGVLKPDVVFFGESVPKPRVQECFDLVEAADSLLVLGSSLTVMSGLRFVRFAERNRMPVLIVNRGRTRGDGLATVKLDQGVADFLRQWELRRLPVG
ncbi:NAD-dependent protein deacetylase [Naumannella sp. ID2617S]|uniref:protein acetyllysine N-acetyltransferase n=1 Tax=Enemella dayhoffiae TaxID=2016507 RepID=A0A255GYN6_9ACTN|nr:NAD-dependent protein deacetylase [Enemella dayhoffiae]NNG20192.1 NAD-dependent protein deacetylase [Naumannella sp. ID2617S]OYO20775.1 NAD-dependent deacetylase [Enemella dayhoffiae]